MYEMTTRIRFSDIGRDGKLRIYELPKLFQDCSIEHSESLGIGIPFLQPRHLAWLLTSWQIDIERLPDYNEIVRIQTWPYEFKSSFGYRNYRMIGEDNEVIVQGYALWLHTDIQEMKPVRVLEEEAEKYGFEPRIDMEYTSRKIMLPDDMMVVSDLTVSPHYADMYRHLNNAMYVDIASDYLPKGGKVQRIRVDYRKQVKVGDQLVIKQQIVDDHCYIAFYDEQDELHVGTEFIISTK